MRSKFDVIPPFFAPFCDLAGSFLARSYSKGFFLAKIGPDFHSQPLKITMKFSTSFKPSRLGPKSLPRGPFFDLGSSLAAKFIFLSTPFVVEQGPFSDFESNAYLREPGLAIRGSFEVPYGVLWGRLRALLHSAGTCFRKKAAFSGPYAPKKGPSYVLYLIENTLKFKRNPGFGRRPRGTPKFVAV
jgi:hypothetical protein